MLLAFGQKTQNMYKRGEEEVCDPGAAESDNKLHQKQNVY